MFVSDGVCCVTGQGGPYSPEGAALGGYGLDRQAHLGLRTAGMVVCKEKFWSYDDVVMMMTHSVVYFDSVSNSAS